MDSQEVSIFLKFHHETSSGRRLSRVAIDRDCGGGKNPRTWSMASGIVEFKS